MADPYELPVLEDPISPVGIDHDVDEIIIDGQLDELYNLLIYHFKKYGRYCYARAYTDRMQKVSIFGPYSDRKQFEPTDAPELYDEVLSYLKRRYRKIDAFVEGDYKTVWEFARYAPSGDTYAPVGRGE